MTSTLTGTAAVAAVWQWLLEVAAAAFHAVADLVSGWTAGEVLAGVLTLFLAVVLIVPGWVSNHRLGQRRADRRRTDRDDRPGGDGVDHDDDEGEPTR